VDEASARQTEIVILGDPRRRFTRRSAIFGTTVDFVLKHAPCRVMVAAAPAPVKLSPRQLAAASTRGLD
jgi:nucleotide-binding universal stress UspA family protein